VKRRRISAHTALFV